MNFSDLLLYFVIPLVLYHFLFNSTSRLQNVLSSAGINELTETQVRILNEGRTPSNTLVYGRPNNGQTMALLILMFESIDVNKNATQAIFVTATIESAVQTFESASILAEGLGIRCGLAKFNEAIDPCTFHCLIGTTASVSKYIGDGIGIELFIFDDANKSMSFGSKSLLKYPAKYVCVTSYANKHILQTSQNELQVIQSSRSNLSILSPNLRHVELFFHSQFEKLSAAIELCKWPNAKQIVVFVLVRKIYFQNLNIRMSEAHLSTHPSIAIFLFFIHFYRKDRILFG